MLMKKNVNNDVSKDSPITASRIQGLPFFRLELRLVFRTRRKRADFAVFKQPGKF